MDEGSAFEAAVDEFTKRTSDLIGRESAEDLPPAPLGDASSSPVHAGLLLDRDTARRYALSIGDDNPIYTDPTYARSTRHGGLVAPGPILVHVRYPADHGASRANGYPLANFFGGVAWEFFDVVRVGGRFSSSKVLREVLTRRGPAGRRHLYLVTELSYFNSLDQPIAKAYGTLIQVPMHSMGTNRAMPVERLGEELFQDRQPHRYNSKEIREIMTGLAAEQRRGSVTLEWENVAIGEELPPIVQPPYDLDDMIAYQALHQGLFQSYDGGFFRRAFVPAYRLHRQGFGYPDYARTHPVTHWPWTPGDEHEDYHLSGYRGQPLSFDFGVQRLQILHRLVSNWAGDEGFCRKLGLTIRRPLFYGDALIVRGKVISKSLVRDPPDDGPMRHSVSVAIEGCNQRGEVVSRGFATIYLSTIGAGPTELPIGYASQPPYAPFERHRSSSWY